MQAVYTYAGFERKRLVYFDCGCHCSFSQAARRISSEGQRSESSVVEPSQRSTMHWSCITALIFSPLMDGLIELSLFRFGANMVRFDG